MITLITGASGFIGQYLLKNLLKSKSEKDKIYCFVRDPDRVPRHIRKHILILKGSDIEIKKYRQIVRSCQYIYHLAARPTLGNGSEYQRDNVEFTKVLINLVQGSKVLRRFVFLSSIAAVDRTPFDNCEHPLNEDSRPNPLTDYGKSKLIAERCLIETKLPYVILRPPLVYGPGMRLGSHLRVLIGYVQDNNPISKIDFSGKVSVIHVEDLVRIILMTAEHRQYERQIYFTASEDITIGEIFLLIRKSFGKTERMIGTGWLPTKQFQKLRHFLPLKAQNLFYSVLWTSSSKIRTTGFTPEHTLRRRMLDLVHWHSRQQFDSMKRAVVTGGASGIGLAISKQLYARGYQITLIDKDKSSIKKAASDLRATSYVADLTNKDSLNRMCTMVSSDKNIDLLVNNAGIGVRNAFPNGAIQKYKEMLQLNCLAPISLTHAFLSEPSKNNRLIINIVSSAAFQPLPYMSVYSASKAFLFNWSLSISGESKDSNQPFSVLTVCPSGTSTNFQSSSGVKTGKKEKLLSPDYVAGSICDAMDKNRQFIIVGLSGTLMWLLSRVLPYGIQVGLWRKLMANNR